MAALLVGLSVMAILMTAIMPTWRQAAQREKEAELVFRGQQYARAIGLFQKRAGPGVLPPSVDVLVDGHFLRKKYSDPITGKDFDLLTATQATAPGSPGAQTGTSQGGRGGGAPSGAPGAAPTVARGGIIGVASKSKDASIRIYNGRTHYNEWQFVYVAQVQAPGQGGVGGERGGRGQGPGGLPGVGGVGGGRDGGRGRGGQGQGPGASFGRGNMPPPSGRGSPGGFPPPSPRN